jgi:hypothetical protein
MKAADMILIPLGCVRFEVLSAVGTSMLDFWVLMPCELSRWILKFRTNIQPIYSTLNMAFTFNTFFHRQNFTAYIPSETVTGN